GFNARQAPHLFDAGELAVRGAKTPVERSMVRADSLFATGKDSLAAIAYDELVGLMPYDHPHRARAIESLVFALYQSEQYEPSVERAVVEMRGLGRTPSAASAAATGLGAALALPNENPKRPELERTLEAATAELLADTSIALSGDDRSGLYISLMDARSDAGDSVG